MLLAIEGSLSEIAAAHAAHQHAAGVERRRCQRLAFDHRRREPTPCDLGNAIGDRLPVGQRRFERLNQQMAVEAEDLVEQFLAEAVHHRHDDDQRRHAEHDAEEGESGDDGDEAFLAPRAQVAQRQHPFEGSEGMGPGRLGHDNVPAPDAPASRFHTILAGFTPWPAAAKPAKRTDSWRQPFSAGVMARAGAARRPGSSVRGCRRRAA